MKKKPTLLLLTFLSFALNTWAQNGQNDVRFVDNTPMDSGNFFPAEFIIEVKAASPDTEFFMSEQNYRFSFNLCFIFSTQFDRVFGYGGFLQYRITGR